MDVNHRYVARVITQESIQMHLWEPNRSERTVMPNDVAVVHLEG